MVPAFALKFLPTNVWVRLAIAPVLVFLALATDRHYLCDFWHHLARGRVIVEEGQLLNHDRFTFTVAGQPFQDVNWLSQVAYYGLYRAGGLDLVYQINAAILALTLFFVVGFAWRKSNSVAIGAIVGVLVFLGLWEVLTIRPQTFSLLLFVVCYAILDASERRPWLLVIPPFLLALWANLHGAFPAGLLLIGCFLAAAVWAHFRSPQRKQGIFPFKNPQRKQGTILPLALCLGASSLATLANPYGWEIYAYVSQTSGRAAARRIDEWVPPNFQQMIGLAFFASLALLFVLVALSAWRKSCRPAARDVILCLVFLPLAAGSVRMVAWWLLILVPIVAQLLAVLLPREKIDTPEDRVPTWGAGIVFALLLLAVVGCLPALQPHNPLLQFTRSGPRTEDDLEALRAHLPPGSDPRRLFSRMEWGEYLGWSMPPDALVFVDGRIEIYPDDVWTHFGAITCGKDNWQRLLDQYEVDALVLDADYHERTGLLTKVRNSAEWRQEAQVREVMLFVRTVSARSVSAGTAQLPVAHAPDRKHDR